MALSVLKQEKHLKTSLSKVTKTVEEILDEAKSLNVSSRSSQNQQTALYALAYLVARKQNPSQNLDAFRNLWKSKLPKPPQPTSGLSETSTTKLRFIACHSPRAFSEVIAGECSLYDMFMQVKHGKREEIPHTVVVENSTDLRIKLVMLLSPAALGKARNYEALHGAHSDVGGMGDKMSLLNALVTKIEQLEEPKC